MLQSPRRGNVLQAYLTIYTTDKLAGLSELADRCFPASMNVIYSQATQTQREIKAKKILTQRPHDFSRLFGEKRIRRYGIINKHLLENIEVDAN